MKKIVSITLILIFCTSALVNSQEIADTDFVGAKAQLLYSYATLENCGLRLNLIVEQNGKNISEEYLMSMVASRGDIELSMVTIKNCLALYTLQSMQLSTSPEAKQLLIDSCLDTNDYLIGLKKRLLIWVDVNSNKEAQTIYDEAISCIDIAKEAINVLLNFTENL